MEPLIAVGLASNVIQFVEFGSKLISEAWHIRKHGSPSSLSELHKISQTLVTQADIIYKGLKATNATLAEEDQHLVDIALECKFAGEEFISYLDTLFNASSSTRTNSKRSLSAFRASLRHSFNKHKIEAFVTKLYELRSTLLLALNLGLRQDAKSNLTEVFEYIRELGTNKQPMLAPEGLTPLSDFDGSDRRTDLTVDHVRAQIDEFLTKIEALREQLPQACTRETQILNWLDFRQLTWRYDEITPAYRDTYSWLFEKPANEICWDDFTVYLSTDHANPYFVNGKAGSGKSTLMKFVVKHKKTAELLALWAGEDCSLVVLHCFFWNLGTKLQKSAVGMLRGLLYDALQRYPDHIPAVFPRLCWNMDATQLAEEPSYVEAMEAFNIFVEKTIGKLKICIFIDGLDEYEGDEHQIREIGQWLRSLTRLNQHVKVVVSSRPITASINTFHGCPTLQLQDLTRKDMKQFIEGHLDGHRYMRALTTQHPQQAQALRTELQEKAQGVFLWVKVVVRLLMTGLEEGDGIEDLTIKLRSLPPDLRQLYKRMFSKMVPEHRAEASQIFQLFRAWRAVKSDPFTTTVLIFALDAPSEVFSLSNEPLDDEKWTYLYSKTEARIRSRCCGLLELYRNPWNWGNSLLKSPWAPPFRQRKTEARPCFLDYRTYTPIEPGPKLTNILVHRTVGEFLACSDIHTELVQLTNSCGFNPYMNLASACLSIIKTEWDCLAAFPTLMAILRQMPDMPSETLKRYLEDLDAAMDRYEPVTFSKPIGKVHWSAGIDSYQFMAVTEREMRLAASLPTVAAREGLFPYLKEFYTLPLGPSTLKEAAPILYALESWSGIIVSQPGCRKIRYVPLDCRRATLEFLLQQWLGQGGLQLRCITVAFNETLRYLYERGAEDRTIPRIMRGRKEALIFAGVIFTTARMPELIFDDVFREVFFGEIWEDSVHESLFLDSIATALERCPEKDYKLLAAKMRPLTRKIQTLSRIQTRIIQILGDHNMLIKDIVQYIDAKHQTILEALHTLSHLKQHANISTAPDLGQHESTLTKALADMEAEKCVTRRFIPHEGGKMHLDIRAESEERLLQIEADLKEHKRPKWSGWNAGCPAERLVKRKIDQLKSELDHFTRIKIELLNKEQTLDAHTDWIVI
ncbi:uncharacterized protein EI97DRAFT_159994 [Westerdykella ornata]|uniref:Uncharacterized protein n=1 Tax=Westerdykella ornata TaxID=318751 RepID=A0A6A6JDL8_WESOR|nr:uncharacterized protein EI97DRAFT_159994 [Westerdykella ornata]KAF2273279.1 hypothetical protein EI97DRAFT_159994 [Westerdykella ornata]